MYRIIRSCVGVNRHLFDSFIHAKILVQSIKTKSVNKAENALFTVQKNEEMEDYHYNNTDL